MTARQLDILVAEDSKTWQLALQRSLTGAGHRVRTCADGMSAIEAVRTDPPELLVMDYLLPKVDGGQLCAYVRAHAELAHMKTIILSGAVAGTLPRESLAAADAVIAKGPAGPTLGRLLDVIANLSAEVPDETYRREVITPTRLFKREIATKIVRLKDHADVLCAHVADAVIEIDEARRLVKASPSAQDLLGGPLPELLGQDLLALLGEPADGPFGRAVAAALDGGASTSPAVVEHALGERRLESTVSVVRHPGGETGAILIARDVSDRHRAEQALREAEEQLRQAQKMEAVGRLAGGVAHDFNNLLTSIGGFAELLLLEAALPESSRSLCEQILGGTRRAAALTQQLLTFARKKPMRRRAVELNALIGDLESLLRRTLGEDVELVTALSASLGSVDADPGQLEQVLMNLAVNARDAMPAGGRLSIATTCVTVPPPGDRRSLLLEPGEYVTLIVADTGCGMDADTRAQIFEPFFTTKPQGQGTGLGLANVYGIVRQLGGDIRVSSEPGQGTTFTLHLPRAARAAEGEVSAPPPPRPELPGGSETLLVVEDNELVRDYIAQTLRRAGFEVLEADGPDRALELFAELGGVVELVLTDVVMPGMSGVDLARRLSADRPETRFMFMSGCIDRVAAAADLLGDGRLLEKPIRPAQLLDAVRAALDGPVR